ncbi:MAG: hypothetical protein ACFFDK_12325 [Promethearchaeota archaeon]
MERIYWLYIIDPKGATLFSYQNAIYGSSKINSTLLSHFIYALQSVAKNLEEDEIKGVDIGNDKFFITKEKLTSYLFIMKTKTTAEAKIINPILKNIENEFVKRFTGHFTLDIDEKVKILKSFEQYVKGVFEGKSNINSLIKALSMD